LPDPGEPSTRQEGWPATIYHMNAMDPLAPEGGARPAFNHSFGAAALERYRPPPVPHPAGRVWRAADRATSPSEGPARRLYIDWLRGVAVLCMILWHAVDSWHVREGRDTAMFGGVIFLAGWAAPLFLFLAGVSLPLAGLARIARGADRRTASVALINRGWQVFLIAHLFRLQSFLFNPNASWNALLKPDILNILGLGLVMTAFAWGRATNRTGRLLWLLLPTLVVVVMLAPLAPTWSWPALLHPRLEAYIRPVGNYGVFSLFPAVGYVFAGAFVGGLLAEGRSTTEAWFHSRGALWGSGIVAASVALAFAPMPPAVEFWTAELAIVAGRVGAMLVMLALSWFLLRTRPPGRRSPLIVFGQTSLFVYWVHVELAYGSFSYTLRNALTLPWALAAYLLLTVVMFACAVLWLRRSPGPVVPSHMVPSRRHGPNPPAAAVYWA